MNESKSLRLWKYAVLLLVLCNIALIATIWVKPNFPGGRRPETPRDFVIRNLKFSDDQVKKYDALINIHRTSMDQLRKESMDYRTQLFNKLHENTNQGITPDSLSQLIAINQKQIELATYNHFAQVRAICTDAQKTTFDKIIGDVTKMMSGNKRGGIHPGDQGPPPRREGPDAPENGRPGPPENE